VRPAPDQRRGELWSRVFRVTSYRMFPLRLPPTVTHRSVSSRKVRPAAVGDYKYTQTTPDQYAIVHADCSRVLETAQLGNRKLNSEQGSFIKKIAATKPEAALTTRQRQLKCSNVLLAAEDDSLKTITLRASPRNMLDRCPGRLKSKCFGTTQLLSLRDLQRKHLQLAAASRGVPLVCTNAAGKSAATATTSVQ
jgi:hypothetical protein